MMMMMDGDADDHDHDDDDDDVADDDGVDDDDDVADDDGVRVIWSGGGCKPRLYNMYIYMFHIISSGEGRWGQGRQ